MNARGTAGPGERGRNAPSTMRSGLARLGRLARKELSESLRDRRTIITLLLMPVLLYPLLAVTFQQVLLYSKLEKSQRHYRIAFTSEAEASAVIETWELGKHLLVRRHSAPGQKDQTQKLPSYLDPLPLLEPSVHPDPESAVRAGNVDVGVRVIPSGAFRFTPEEPIAITLQLSYRSGATYGSEAVRYLEVLTGDVNANLAGWKLALTRNPQRGDALRVRAVELADESGKKSDLVPVLVPLILILMTMTGAVYPAIDLTAGERERNTLEILIAAPIPRLSVLLAKYVAVLTVAMLTALVNLGSMVLTLQVTGIGPALFGSGLTLGVLISVLLLLVLFAGFFSAVVLALTSFARSFKEAQAYLIPLMLLCLAPGMLALLPRLDLEGPLAVVPLVNIVLLAREVLAGTANPVVTGLVVATTVLYAVASIALAARVFGTEAVLSSEPGGWGDLFRRAPRPRRYAEPASALLCLALMFPAYFVLNNLLARMGNLDLSARFALAALSQVVLFACFPFLSAWLGRVELVSGFRLYRPGWQACIIAVLLGMSLWPFIHELIVWQKAVGWSSLRKEYLEKMREVLVQWRAYSPWLMVAILAVAPAVLEELFFRGYLLTALAGDSKREGRAIVASAGLFALFHLLVTDSLAVERFLPSFLMGWVLGWLAVASGSVVPGMLLHAIHNGLLVLLGYYQPELTELGWVVERQESLPAWFLAAAVVPAGPGLVWLWRLARRHSGAGPG